MRKNSYLLAIGFVSAVLTGPANSQLAADSDTVICASMKAKLSRLDDGSLFYRPASFRKGDLWQKLGWGESLEVATTTKMHFIYVARESWLDSRPGMVVIKTGRTVTDATQPTPEIVNLSRLEDGQVDNGTCGALAPFSGSVVAESYDRYHDAGARVPVRDRNILKQFHAHYVGRGEQCKDSNSVTGDTLFGRTNRGQFSFNTGIVGGRLRDQIVANLQLPFASASSGFSDRSVEVHRYRTNASRIACIAFDLTISRPNFFLRINDLERVEGSAQYSERGRETEWNLAR
jgi:hypothetical protein